MISVPKIIFVCTVRRPYQEAVDGNLKMLTEEHVTIT